MITISLWCPGFVGVAVAPPNSPSSSYPPKLHTFTHHSPQPTVVSLSLQQPSVSWNVTKSETTPKSLMAPWWLSHLPPQMAFKLFQSIKCNTTVVTHTNLIPGKEDGTSEMKSPKVWPLGCKQSLWVELGWLYIANYHQDWDGNSHWAWPFQQAWPDNRPPKEQQMVQSKYVWVESNSQGKWPPKRRRKLLRCLN